MKTILLIEDNADILENLTEYFEMEGYKVIGANSGRKGIELAKEFIPDLIICDALMRVMDGHEVLHLLLENEKTSQMPFIFSTSMSEKIDRAEALELGADDYIIKPFDPETLLKMAKTWIASGTKRPKRSGEELQKLIRVQ
jgi:DNA-binding response OmpR family regulator